MAKRVLYSIITLVVLTTGPVAGSFATAGNSLCPLAIDAPPERTVTIDTLGCMVTVDLLPATVDTCVGCRIRSFQVVTPFGVLMTNGGLATFNGPGRHQVIYSVTDDCRSMVSDTTYVTVLDPAPIAICQGPRVVALGSDGMVKAPARAFDGGSYDFCPTRLYFKVKRIPDLDSTCQNPANPQYMFDDYVKFCCEDVGDTVDVILRVYDTIVPAGIVSDTAYRGRFSDCPAKVIVQDKLAPVLTCPPDITIECGEHIDFDTLLGPDVADNCDTISLRVIIEKDLDRCGVGEFRRIIIATDGGGQMDTCIQRIFVVNNHPFDGNDTMDLKWPEPFVMVYDCTFVPDTSVSGGPVVLDNDCSMVSVSWTDEVYKFSRDACSKVIRNFRVVDWCQYDPRVDARCIPENGCWTFEQIIKVVDTIAPIITRPNDTIVPYLKPGCTDMMVELDSATTDKCFIGEEVDLSFKVDHFRDGIIDRIGSDGDASGIFPVGKHWIIYSATDECGNTTIDTMSIEIKDRVLPAPIAMTDIRAALVDMGGGLVMTTVNARQLNASSYDNCTNQEDLRFSFSPNVNDTIATFDCSDVPSANVKLWVTDLCGNKNSVNLTILIQDTGEHCPDSVRGTNISGLIERHDGTELSNIEVALYEGSDMSMSPTDQAGQYMISDVKTEKNYDLVPQPYGDILEGVTTKDMVIIQRHLLGKQPFDQVYQYLGADVNGSGHVSSSDVVEIRKLILGNISNFKIGKQWHFIPEGWQFIDDQDPWKSPWPERLVIQNLQGPVTANFKGYRIGDVDMSYTNSNSNQPRTADILDIAMTYDDETGTLSLVSEEEIWVTGFQFSAEVLGDLKEGLQIVSDLKDWSEACYRFDHSIGSLRISWSNDEPVWIAKGMEIMSVISQKGSNLSLEIGNDLEAECYDQYLSTHNLVFGNRTRPEEWINLTVQPNPFQDQTQLTIYSTEDHDVQILIRDIIGSSLKMMNIPLVSGWNDVVLDNELFPHQGVYLLEVTNGSRKSEVKVIKAN